jgi:hypothetical protein
MKKTNITILLLLLSISLVSAWSWSGIFTGKAVAPNSKIDNVDPTICSDSNLGTAVDGGAILTASWGTRKLVIKEDFCSGKSEEFWTAEGKKKGYDKITVYYCDENGKSQKSTYGREELGEDFVCVSETKDIKGKELRVGVAIEKGAFCTSVQEGYRDETGKITPITKCEGNNFIQATCDGTKITLTSTVCENECSSEGCSYKGYCTGDTDSEDNPYIKGMVSVKDGEEVELKEDYCTRDSNQLVQVSCGSDNSLVYSKPVQCQGGEKCTQGICFNDLSTTEGLKKRVDLLEEQVSALMKALCTLHPTSSLCEASRLPDEDIDE